MRITLLFIIGFTILLSSCGGSKKTSQQKGKDTGIVKLDSIPKVVNGDTTKALKIPAEEKFINFKSDALTTWIKTYLKTEEDSLDTNACIQLLNTIGVKPLQAFRKDISGIAFRSTWNKGRYVVGIRTSCEVGDEIEFVFAINVEKKSLIKFTTFFGRACNGNSPQDYGELDNFYSFGPYYTIIMYRSGWGQEGMMHIVLNDNLDEMGYFDLAWLGGEDLGNDKYSQYEWNYEYEFGHDSMIMHCFLKGDNGKKKWDEELDVVYTCYRDSIHLSQPEQMIKHNELIDEMTNMGE